MIEGFLVSTLHLSGEFGVVSSSPALVLQLDLDLVRPYLFGPIFSGALLNWAD